MTTPRPLLSIEDLHLDFDTFEGPLHVLDGVSLTLDAGETVGIVGETGCGKSVTVRSILRLLPMPPARFSGGSIRFKDVISQPRRNAKCGASGASISHSSRKTR